MIRVRGARQNNLRHLDIDIPTGQIVVVTGVSGSGKSSLVFDTLYAEGQRRYVETFSPYARQFLDRMDRPQVDRIEGIPPAIAIDQTNPVRNSRSTVGTMTEINDHLKLLFARAGRLFCRQCAAPVERDDPQTIARSLRERATALGDPRLVVCFPLTVPANFSTEEVLLHLEAQGYARLHGEPQPVQREGQTLQRIDVVQDRFRISTVESSRLFEAIETSLKQGQGRVRVYALLESTEEIWDFSSDLHCASCDLAYALPQPASFSFNSPLGACEACRGFGRVIGVDYGLVIPDPRKTLREGAVKPWQTNSFKDCQADLLKYGQRDKIRLDLPFEQLSEAERTWLLDGQADFAGTDSAWSRQWYGVRRFFDWLESKSYKMHIRVLLSKYRAYTPCPSCQGARLKPDALLWRVGDAALAQSILPAEGRYTRFKPIGSGWTPEQLDALPGLNLQDLMHLPIDQVRQFVDGLRFEGVLDQAMELVLTELRSRLRFLCEVGLGYLTLDRQSRTLSGGEVQRINLTTALGTSLVNALFVLDEPSIGLHPRDLDRVVAVMQRLRDAGNSLVVVEHDPAIMRAADQIIDIGPGPGERGGQLCFQGSPSELLGADTLTSDYLSGRKHISSPHPRAVLDSTPRLLIEGAAEHNLRHVDVGIPLQRLVCVAGVSGSGKSTLIQDLLYPALLKKKGKSTEAPGKHTRVLGHELIADVVMVDQSPIGKTARSTPASYVGAFDAIRALFADAPLARERGYTAGTFSFNAGDGRCPSCGGTGFEHVEMQFLSDVYLRCPDCDGTRYRPEIREVELERQGRSLAIHQVLELTVHEALRWFTGCRDVLQSLSPLADVGLDYLRLGQPVPTLSGGEAQRLKLAGFLAESARTASASAQSLSRRGTLYLFDEPTTGLHFDDIARLMGAFRKLLAAGHSLVVIEHNLDVLRAADWLIELGPEGGDAGGLLVAQGSPAQVAADADTATARALRAEAKLAQPIVPRPSEAWGLADGRATALRVAETESDIGRPLQKVMRDRSRAIEVRNAREHNLRGIDVRIPHGAFTVVTGVSGSGKSTLAFDIIFNEGQRRYLESINAYARAVVQPAGKPDVDAVHGIPPTVAIEQRTSRGGRKSTVATLTELYHFLRLVYMKLGTQVCPSCQVEVQPQTFDRIVSTLLRDFRGQRIGLLAPLVTARKGYYTDLAKWAQGKGYTHLRVDGVFTPVEPWPRLDRFKEHTIELPVADLVVDPAREQALRDAVRQTLQHGHGVMSVLEPLDRLAMTWPEQSAASLRTQVFSIKRACPSCGTSFPEPDPRLFSYNSKHGWCVGCYGTGLAMAGFDGEQTGEEAQWLETNGGLSTCSQCDGERLNPVARAVRWREKRLPEVTAQTVDEAWTWFEALYLSGREAEIARDLLAEVRSRLSFLREVGLGYLALDRAAPTLSGGEAQRIRLAAQLGSNLQGVCYVLDEPTIGLHPRDNRILLDALEKLGRKGNTLLVVEHDEDTIRRADHLIDIGPGAGVRGGRLVAEGRAEDLMAQPESVTGRYLAQAIQHPLQARRAVDPSHPVMRIQGARLHNLLGVTADIPLQRLSVITGVSGSGKSSLARGVLLENLQTRLTHPHSAWVACDAIEGFGAIERVLEVDQTPIGKTPRSCPATYVGFWDAIRKLFADTAEARMRGWTAARFSFNTGPGRCPACEGQGMRTVEMSFLPDVKVLCDVCNGQRFNRDTLSVRLRDRSIGEVLAMEVDDALPYFAAHPAIAHPLQLLQDVGLGYLTLGQASPTLSGGEAQRIKLVTELARARATEAGKAGRASRAPHTLYVLDEPTVGLSAADTERLIHVLHRLTDAGHTVVLIEHNLDLIAEADWIIDLGPEGGRGGGEIVVQGDPDTVMEVQASHTGRLLREFLDRAPIGA